MKNKEDYNYFNEFINISNCIVDSSVILKETLENYTKELEENILKVHVLEHKADRIIHGMRNYLIKDFLPPIEREDIILIGHTLDDVEDYIDEILINFNILNITNIREDAIEFANLLSKCCRLIKELLECLKNFKKIDLVKNKTIEINQLEEEGDKLFEKCMKKLYIEESNPVDIIKWTTIYNCFENTIDACEKIGDCVEDVMMKNS